MSTPQTTYDFEIDYDEMQVWAAKVARAIDRGITAATILYWKGTKDWCQVCDPFGKMIRGVDWPMEVNRVYDLESVTAVYHPGVKIPCIVRVLATATHDDAERINQGPLPRRKFYYEVIAD